jgi:WD40 repeat protein
MSASADGTVKLWESGMVGKSADKWKLVESINDFGGAIPTTLELYQSGPGSVLIGLNDGTTRVWDNSSRSIIQKLGVDGAF